MRVARFRHCGRKTGKSVLRRYRAYTVLHDHAGPDSCGPWASLLPAPALPTAAPRPESRGTHLPAAAALPLPRTHTPDAAHHVDVFKCPAAPPKALRNGHSRLSM
ncbi:hypothetical protein BV20DRAFT_974346 [Pilatotrama ljubarskyi]|nr:hypothetical protein BV20DRAFT_974346 [Pilatotrama ljubarskyi]